MSAGTSADNGERRRAPLASATAEGVPTATPRLPDRSRPPHSRERQPVPGARCLRTCRQSLTLQQPGKVGGTTEDDRSRVLAPWRSLPRKPPHRMGRLEMQLDFPIKAITTQRPDGDRSRPPSARSATSSQPLTIGDRVLDFCEQRKVRRWAGGSPGGRGVWITELELVDQAHEVATVLRGGEGKDWVARIGRGASPTDVSRIVIGLSKLLFAALPVGVGTSREIVRCRSLAWPARCETLRGSILPLFAAKTNTSESAAGAGTSDLARWQHLLLRSIPAPRPRPEPWQTGS